MISAVTPGTVGCTAGSGDTGTGDGVTAGAGGGTAAPTPAPPEAVAPGDGGPDPFALAAPAVGAPVSANTAKLGSITWATRNGLFRRPAGLADGLALKEPAPPTGSPWDSPQGTGSPAPRI